MNKNFLFLVNFLVLLTSYVFCADLGEHSLELDGAHGCKNPASPNACITDGKVLCVNLQTNNNNCGACGIVCPPGVDCGSGTCGTCPISGQIVCDGACIATSSANCGTCGTTCSATESCTGVGSAATCVSLGFSVDACVLTTSTGTGTTNADEPVSVLVSGPQSISAYQCFQYCNALATDGLTTTPTFFTLYTDTTDSGLPVSSGSVNTWCSCYTGATFDTSETSLNCTTNGFGDSYGVTSNGGGSWEVYSVYPLP